MKKVYRNQTFEVFLTEFQKESFWNTAISCRRVHNHFLRVLGESGKPTNMKTLGELHKELIKMKGQERYCYLKDADSQALNATIFWVFNKFKKDPEAKPIIGRMKEWTCCLHRFSGMCVSGNHVNLPKLKWVELSEEPIFKGAAVKCSITGDWEQDRYWVELFWK